MVKQDLEENQFGDLRKISKLVFHPEFEKTIRDIRNAKISITDKPQMINSDFSDAQFPRNGSLQIIDKIKRVKLDAELGEELSKKYLFTGYDESKLNYLTLEGSAFFTSHSLVVTTDTEFIPISYLSVYFYTRSKHLKEKFPLLTLTDNSFDRANLDYVLDRNNFFKSYSIPDTISFIDGPLIGGNMTSYTLKMVKMLHENNILPIFIVKNSGSNLVTDNIKELTDRYNSDLHWSHSFLRQGERTNFFIYTDEHNPENTKVFCYLKPFYSSPQRIELHIDTYRGNKEGIERLTNLIYYLLIVDGEKSKPQLRPIRIAENIARELLKLSNTYQLIKSSGLTPTLNQERFGE